MLTARACARYSRAPHRPVLPPTACAGNSSPGEAQQYEPGRDSAASGLADQLSRFSCCQLPDPIIRGVDVVRNSVATPVTLEGRAPHMRHVQRDCAAAKSSVALAEAPLLGEQ
jgi:hypothetical protein